MLIIGCDFHTRYQQIAMDALLLLTHPGIGCPTFGF